MWNEQSQYIRAQLTSSEKLFWMGQPKQGLVFRPIDALYIPLSILACWFFFGWVWGSFYNSESPLPSRIIIIVFAAMLLCQWFGRFLVDAWYRKRTYYGVTNERVIVVIAGLFNQTVSSLNLNTPSEMTLSLKKDGRGTIIFGYPNAKKESLISQFFSNNSDDTIIVFELIPDAQKVYESIRNAQKQKYSLAQ